MITVSRFMPTMPGREKFLQRAITSFQQQQYPADWHLTLFIDNDPTDTLGAASGGANVLSS
jgi:hypothetical protein